MAETDQLRVETRDGEIIVSVGEFCAVYFKSPGQPQLVLRSRTDTDDYQLLVKVREAANDKAREIGWIV